MRKIFLQFVVSLALAGAGVVAQDAITINGGGETVLRKAPPTEIQRTYHAPKLKTIYSNLGKGKYVYQSDSGWTISGSDSQQGEWIQACGFTPKANATITEIKVGFTWMSGPNQGTIAVYGDRGGVPGKALYTFKPVKNLPTFGTTTSILQTVKYAAGINVQKNKQYWVVLTAPSKTWDVWNWQGYAMGPEAYNNGDGWSVRQYLLGAFGVFGK